MVKFPRGLSSNNRLERFVVVEKSKLVCNSLTFPNCIVVYKSPTNLPNC